MRFKIRILPLCLLFAATWAAGQSYERTDSLWNIALKKEKTDNWQEAAMLWEQATVAEKACAEPRMENLYYYAKNASYAWHQSGNMEKAFILRQKSYELIKREFPADYEQIGSSASWLALYLKDQGEYQKALPLYVEALECTEKTLGKDHSEYGTKLNNLAIIYRIMGQYDKALPISLEALENTRNTLGKDHLDYYNRLNNLAVLYRNMGQYDMALPLYLEVLENIGKTLGKDHSVYGTLLNNLALLYKTMGQNDKALPLCLEALANTEKNLGKDHSEYGDRLDNLAQLYRTMGQYEKALLLSLEAVENTEKTQGKGHSDYGYRINNLAVLYATMGQNEKALPLFMEALDNTEKTLGKGHSEYGTRLNNLASLYQNMGQYDKALPLSLEALENTEKALGKGHSEYSSCLNTLAELYVSMGQYNQALPLFLEALKNTENTLGKDHADYGTGLNNLASLYSTMGQYDKALPLLKEALENTEKTMGQGHSDYGNRLNNLANFHQNMGQYNKALPLYLEALENTEKNLGKDHAAYGNHLNNLAELYRTMDLSDKALPLYMEAFDNIKDQIQRSFAFMSEKEKEQFLKTMLFNLENYQSFLSHYPQKDRQVSLFSLDIELTRKGLLLQSGIAMRRAVLLGGDTALLREFEDWSFTKSILARQYSLPLSNRRTDLNELETKAEQMEAVLTRKSSDLKGALQVGQIKWHQLRDALPEKAAAIEFVSFRYRRATGWTDSTLYMALVLRRGDTMPHRIPLFEQRQLDSFIKKTGGDESFVSSLYRTVKLNRKETEKVQYGKRLFELLWKPLDSLLQPGYEVYLSPSGTLNQIAFAAIPYDSVSTLSDRYKLHTVGTSGALLKPQSNKRPNSIIIYGGIDYDEATVSSGGMSTSVRRILPGDLQRSGESWSYLEGTLHEAESIADIASKKGIQAKLLTGNQATEESLKVQTGSNAPHVLHIATHGFFFPDPPKAVKEQDGFIGGQQEPVFKLSDNPLNRSGILLASGGKTWAGATAAEGREDGILTAYEASYLQLAKTKLVVLSACETGLGTVKGSEGVYGLQRAFKQAGAQYLLISLWKVPDAETAEFMTIFYGHYFGGSTVEEAYYLTQKAMREKFRNDPYMWAAFVLIR